MGSLVALKYDLSIREVSVVSRPRVIYDMHILMWVSLQKPHHPLDRYYTMAEPGLWTYRVRARSAPGSEEALLQHIRFQLLERGSNVSLSPREECVSGNRDFW